MTYPLREATRTQPPRSLTVDQRKLRGVKWCAILQRQMRKWRAVMTHHHPVGTCRTGRTAGSVVDADLKLHGFEGLYVVDASVIPAITSGPIHAAVLAIAETFAADIAGPLLR